MTQLAATGSAGAAAADFEAAGQGLLPGLTDEGGRTLALFRCTQLVMYPKPGGGVSAESMPDRKRGFGGGRAIGEVRK